MKTVNERISALRNVMRKEGLDAFIFPSTDPHNGEYVPSHWKGREFISGFNGSAGTAVVTLDEAALWTDSRYFIAAAGQLAGTEFVLMKYGLDTTPSITEWLGRKLAVSGGTVVGIDGMVNSVSVAETLIGELRMQGGITVRTNFDPLDVIWTDRPPVPEDKVEIHPLEYAGETTDAKLAGIRKELKRLHAGGILVSALDDVAWILNLRGNDVHCNPVFVSYLLIDGDRTTLFVDDKKLTDEVRDYLKSYDVDLRPYDDVAGRMDKYSSYSILIDADETSYALYKRIERRCKVVFGKSPVPSMKAVKNASEIAGFRRAMLRDGVAMVKFLRWLLPAVGAGGQTELSVGKKLDSLRAGQEQFRDISFDSIVGYEHHGAIVHYEATEETDIPLSSKGLLLIDSGGQYRDGTTDITRTIALGTVTEEQRHVYTLVLKGHIRLEMAKFPCGASGTQIDALARLPLWREGFNYLHGTGHGVGSYLNVHEGPHQIRMEWRPAPLVPGMTVTDEPGIYIDGKFGVRIENTLLVTDYMHTAFGRFLQFEPLTLCPIDKSPIDRGLLDEDEVCWLNGYHRMVRDRLMPFLDDDADRAWLEAACSEL